MRIKEKRLSAGIKQCEVMKDVSLYSKIENGKAIATESDSRRMAELFGCELDELFTKKELAFFEGLSKAAQDGESKDKEFAAKEEKLSEMPICKPLKRHLGFVRKCYWLNKTRSEELKRAVTAMGYRTAQDWYSDMVDKTIYCIKGEKPFTNTNSIAYQDEDVNFYYSDYMGREEEE